MRSKTFGLNFKAMFKVVLLLLTSTDQIAAYLLQSAIDPGPAQWIAPYPLLLLGQANVARRVPEADGWSGNEAASLPVEAWTMLGGEPSMTTRLIAL
jgi:hypothetical protein